MGISRNEKGERRPGSLTDGSRGLDHSQSKLHYDVQKKEEMKTSNTTKKNENTLETTEKEMEMQNRIVEDIDKKSTTHTNEQPVQWLTSVALIHTLKGLGGVNIINRLREIQVVVKKIFLEARYCSQCCRGGLVKYSRFLGLYSKNCSQR